MKKVPFSRENHSHSLLTQLNVPLCAHFIENKILYAAHREECQTNFFFKSNDLLKIFRADVFITKIDPNLNIELLSPLFSCWNTESLLFFHFFNYSMKRVLN